MKLARDDTGVSYDHEVIDTSDTVMFRADGLRRTSTGIHAKVTIGLNNTRLGYDNFNIERDGDRGRLLNGAVKLIEKDKALLFAAFPKEHWKHELDLFCDLAWDTWVGGAVPEPMAGDPNIPIAFALKPYIIEGGGSILFGPPGRGKSYVLILMAVSIDAGINKFWPVKQSRVLVINLERSASSFQRRLGQVNRALGLGHDRGLLVLNARGKSLADIASLVEETIRKHGVTTVFLDSMSRAGFGDLTSNQVGNAIVDTLNNLAPTWMGIAHSPRSDDGHVFGSVHFDAGADVVVGLSSEQRELTTGIGLSIVKANDVGKQPMGMLGLKFEVDIGLVEAYVPRKAEFPELVASRRMTLEELIKDVILDTPGAKATADEVASALGRDRSNMSRFLSGHNDFVKIPDGRKTYYAVKTASTGATSSTAPPW